MAISWLNVGKIYICSETYFASLCAFSLAINDYFVENFISIFLCQFGIFVYFCQNLTSRKFAKMKILNSDLGQYLRELRKEKGQTLHQVSVGTDIDSPLLSKLERGERLPTSEQIKKLAKHYKVAETDLKVKATAERIIKEYGVNDTTYEAVNLVMEQITPYIKK